LYAAAGKIGELVYDYMMQQICKKFTTYVYDILQQGYEGEEW
jgi:hypothetical protein